LEAYVFGLEYKTTNSSTVHKTVLLQILIDKIPQSRIQRDDSGAACYLQVDTLFRKYPTRHMKLLQQLQCVITRGCQVGLSGGSTHEKLIHDENCLGVVL